MTNNKKIATTIIRVIALAFIFEAIAPFIAVVFLLVYGMLFSDPRSINNYPSIITTSISHLFIGLILFAGSQPLANYLIDLLKDEELPNDGFDTNLPTPQD